MSFEKKLIFLAAVMTWHTPANAFVLLSKTPHRLAATPEAPTVTFVWDELAPGIGEKSELFDGAQSELSDADYMALLLQLAMDQWNDVHGSFLKLELTRDPTITSSGTASGEDALHTITLDPSVGTTAAAYATPNWQVGGNDSNVIGDCDVHISDRDTTALSLIRTLVHELGHCVGLGHNHSNYKAIMGYARDGDSYKLGADDQSGVIWLYPDPTVIDESPKDLIACGVVPGVGDFRTNPGLWAGVLLALPLLWAGISARGRT